MRGKDKLKGPPKDTKITAVQRERAGVGMTTGARLCRRLPMDPAGPRRNRRARVEALRQALAEQATRRAQQQTLRATP